MRYYNFDLEIGQGPDGDYPVKARSEFGGEVQDTIHLPLKDQTFQDGLRVLQAGLVRSDEKQFVRNFGEGLFDALFPRDIRSLFNSNIDRASQEGNGLRIRLHISPPELATLPWEFLYDGQERKYLCLSNKTPIIRYLDQPQANPRLAITLPLRVLVMIVSPGNLQGLDDDKERSDIVSAFKDLQKAGKVELTFLPGQTVDELQKTMWGAPWHVFHFIGHGGFDLENNEGYLSLANEKGLEHRLYATQLADLIADDDSLRLVVLNSCQGAQGSACDLYSSAASILALRDIAAVLAMQYRISDRAAIKFSQVFYEALANGLPVDTATTEARKAVDHDFQNSHEWGTPVLYMRSSNGILFDKLDLQPPLPPKNNSGRLWPKLPIKVAALLLLLLILLGAVYYFFFILSIPMRTKLYVTTDPPGAKIKIIKKPDQEFEYSEAMELDPGEYVIWAEATNCSDTRETITVSKGEPKKEVKIELEPKLPIKEMDMEFILIKKGIFQMGTKDITNIARIYSDNDLQIIANEYPRIPVEIKKDFYLQNTEVTQGQWISLMGGDHRVSRLIKRDKKDWEKYPVENVSWEDANEFTKKLNEREPKKNYRLPTEEEWEFACRAGSTAEFCFGDKIKDLKYYGWYGDNPEHKPNEKEGERESHPVNQLKKNAWGLYDMHGNVWEWCQDEYKPYGTNKSCSPGVHVLRGGCYASVQTCSLRSAFRLRHFPNSQNTKDAKKDDVFKYYGFRVAHD
jgi:formylglycine-generating enzyme required for sulfatase activity/CHAT domain-containing protein